MPQRLLWLLALLLLLLLPCARPVAAAGPPPERWSGWGDTLFRQHVQPLVAGANVMAEDANGMIWIGTQSGLIRWDGYRFRPYVADPQTPGALPDNDARALHVDARGRLWVGGNTGGLARFDAEQDRFVAYPAGPAGSAAANVHAIVGDGSGGLWVGTSAGLQHLDAADRLTPARAMPGLPLDSVEGLLRDRGGALWVMTRRALLRRPHGAAAFVPVPLPLPASHGTAPVITKLYEDGSGRIWAGSQAHGAFVMQPGGVAAVAVVESGERPALASDRVLSIVEAAPGEIWIGTEGGGIVVVDTARGSTRRIRHQAGSPSSLSDDEVMVMLRDSSGLVWVDTNNALHQHDPQQRSVVNLRGGGDRPEGISHINVPFVLPMPDGRVWLSVGSAGVDIVDPMRGRVAQLRPDATRPEQALPKARVLAMAAGDGGSVYIGTRLGLYLSDADGRQVRRLEVAGREPSANVSALHLDGDTLWLGGGSDGLWSLDVRDPARPRVLRHDSEHCFDDARIASLLRGSGDTLWVGTQAGLFRMNVASGDIEAVSSDSTDPTRLPTGYLSSMLIDRRGRLWLSSFGTGVLLQDGQRADGSPRFRRFGLREGLPHVGADKLLEDARGDIWVSTDDGLAVIDGERLTLRALQAPQGLGVQMFWSGSGAVTAAGELLFGGQGGLVVVRPERLGSWTHRPRVVVTEARVGDAALPYSAFGGAAASAPGGVPRIDVAAAVRGLWVEFAALDYSAPERNRYAYRLLGFDADWIPTDPTRRLASYTNLPPGDYTLQLRGSNRDGVWTDPPLAIPVRVLPAWYQTAWARGAAAVAVLLALAALVQARTVYLRRRQRELEAQVAARTAELHVSQRQLEAIAYADPLTGLPNRRVFTEDLRRQVAQSQRSGEPFALLLVDLDGFKAVNDSRGHDAGDALLVEAAARFGAVLREGDRVARMGGDEFAVLLAPGSEPAAVDAICRRLVERFAEPVPFEGGALRVTASIGVASHPADGATPAALYKAADTAMYAAKRGGRNTWRSVAHGRAAA